MQLADWIAPLQAASIAFAAERETGLEKTSISERRLWTLRARGDCRTIAAWSGASCGISGADFTKYNPDPQLCSTLLVGRRVCCSAGTLPDIRPKPHLDGSYFPYVIQSGDTCSTVAAANGLTVEDLATFKDKTTLGWNRCNHLTAQLVICLSKGSLRCLAQYPTLSAGQQFLIPSPLLRMKHCLILIPIH